MKQKGCRFSSFLVSPTFLEVHQSSIFCKNSTILTRRFIRLWSNFWSSSRFTIGIFRLILEWVALRHYNDFCILYFELRSNRDSVPEVIDIILFFSHELPEIIAVFYWIPLQFNQANYTKLEKRKGHKLEERWCGRRDLNPGSLAWKANVLNQTRRRPLDISFMKKAYFKLL